MPTTTNYGWTTPADTDLVKDGASAIRTLGTAIDTTVFNNAGAAIAKSIVDAKGDLIIGSADNTVARLAVGGTNGHVLTVNSGATYGAEWAAVSASGMTLINTGGTTLTGASVTISSIPGTYNYLKLFIEECRPATDGTYIMMRFNGDSTSSRYQSRASSYDASNVSFVDNHFIFTNDMDNGTSNAIMTVDIYGYANTATWKYGFSQGVQNNQTTTTNFNPFFRTLFYNQTAAVTSIYLAPSSGNFTSGTAYLYGVK